MRLGDYINNYIYSGSKIDKKKLKKVIMLIYRRLK